MTTAAILLGSVVVGVALGIGGVFLALLYGPDVNQPW